MRPRAPIHTRIPINGLHPVLDFNRMELLDVGDTGPVEPAAVMGEYEPELVPGQRSRDDANRCTSRSPTGPPSQLDGNELRWQNWSLRVGFNYREGLVLHQVGYDDHGREREIAHRMSLAEMIVPYRDPGSTTTAGRPTTSASGAWVT